MADRRARPERRACPSVRCGCACRCCAIREGVRKTTALRERGWTTEQADFLRRALRRGANTQRAAELLNERFKTDRSESAVRSYLARNGLTARADGVYTRADFRTMLGMSNDRVDRLLAEGKVRHDRPRNKLGLPQPWYAITREAIEAFVDAWVGIEFQPSQVVDASLRSRAEVALRARNIKAMGVAPWAS